MFNVWCCTDSLFGYLLIMLIKILRMTPLASKLNEESRQTILIRNTVELSYFPTD